MLGWESGTKHAMLVMMLYVEIFALLEMCHVSQASKDHSLWSLSPSS